MHRGLFLYLLILLLCVCEVTKSEAQATLQTDEELMALGARIGNISIQVDDVFEDDVQNPGRPLAAPYRAVNTLHINTRPATIAAQLLFQTGDLFDRRLLDESERLLRSQRYLNSATIRATSYDASANTVDLLVRVHDVWTLSPGISFGRKGGTNSTSVELDETNLLGFGKRIEFWRSQDVDRTSLRLRYIDPNLFSSRWRLGAAYVSSSDGGERSFDVERPFYALEAKWSAGARALDTTTGIPRYRLGELVEQFNMRKRAVEINGGISNGLEDGWVRRYLGGVRYESREFSSFQNQPASLPADRTLGYPWLGIEWLEDNYQKTRNHDQIGRTEDIHLGVSARLEAGYAMPALDSTKPAFVFGGSLSLGTALGGSQSLFSDLSLAGRIEESELRNSLVEFGSRYYLRQNRYSGFFASINAGFAAELDPERQLSLGGDNGLRGYPLRYQSGTGYALLTVEERFYTPWQPFKLFDVGAAVFFDAGRTFGSDPYGGEPFGVLKDIGLGLRLGNARSALGNVLHIDVAFPLDGQQSIAGMQFIVETRRSF